MSVKIGKSGQESKLKKEAKKLLRDFGLRIESRIRWIHWKESRTENPQLGVENQIHNEMLAKALQEKRKFTQGELDAFGVTEVSDKYIWAGDKYLSAEKQECHSFHAKIMLRTFNVEQAEQEYIQLERAMHELTGKEPLSGESIYDDIKAGGATFMFPGRQEDHTSQVDQRITNISKQINANPKTSKPTFAQKLSKIFRGKRALLSPGPSSILSVSATLMPIFLRINREGKENVDAYVVKPDEEYVGLGDELLEPLHLQSEDCPEGEETFLLSNELRKTNGYGVGGIEVSEWNEKVRQLYEDAHAQEKQGVLLLDAVNPR